MNQIFEVIAPPSFQDVMNSAKKHFHSSKHLNISGFDQIRKEAREYLKVKYSIPDNKPLIATGHQPDLFHPGILFKDFYASKIAKGIDGTAIHFTVDTDEFEWNVSLPIKSSNRYSLSQKSYHSSSGKIYKYCQASDLPETKLLEHIENGSATFAEIFSKGLSETAEKNLKILSDGLRQRKNPLEIYNSIRTGFLEKHPGLIIDVSVYDLIHQEFFKKFTLFFSQESTRFRTIFNNSLRLYRDQHKIKNHAQPLPDIREGETPFWNLLENGGRNPALPDELKAGGTFLPKANALTIFIRYFISDLFIHGTGGGRYEAVADMFLEDFFGNRACPYIVCSATMNYSSKLVSGKFLSRRELEEMERLLQYSPEQFLEENNPLTIEKKKLLEKIRVPAENKKEIHDKIKDINFQMKAQLKEVEEKISQGFASLPEKEALDKIYNCRTYPFFLYNYEELFSFFS